MYDYITGSDVLNDILELILKKEKNIQSSIWLHWSFK